MEMEKMVFNLNSNIKFDFSREEVDNAFSLLKKAFQKKYAYESEEAIEDMVSDYMLMYSTPSRKSFIQNLKEKLTFSSYKQLFYFKNSWTRSYIVVNDLGKIIR